MLKMKQHLSLQVPVQSKKKTTKKPREFFLYKTIQICKFSRY